MLDSTRSLHLDSASVEADQEYAEFPSTFDNTKDECLISYVHT